jgi:hypothetical protein
VKDRRIEKRKSGADGKDGRIEELILELSGEDRQIGNDLLELPGGDIETGERTPTAIHMDYYVSNAKHRGVHYLVGP